MRNELGQFVAGHKGNAGLSSDKARSLSSALVLQKAPCRLILARGFIILSFSILLHTINNVKYILKLNSFVILNTYDIAYSRSIRHF
jgi:hypothetical protein